MEAIQFLKENHLSTFLKTRNEVEIQISNNQSMFCVCGKLASGLHESNCKKFQKKVDSETAKQLKHLVTQ